MKAAVIWCVGMVFLAGCKTVPYAPPPTEAVVQTVTISVADFNGRPDVYADVQGRLSSNAAQLVDSEQSRGRGNLLMIRVLEQTPRGETGTNQVPHPPFQTRIPIDTMGLHPGRVYLVDVNGARASFRMPDPSNDASGFLTSSSTTGLESYASR